MSVLRRSDSKHQIVVSAEAFGQGQEHGLLEPLVEQIDKAFDKDVIPPSKQAKVLADSGFCNKDTLNYLEKNQIDGYLADHGFRSRDPRFGRCRPAQTGDPEEVFRPKPFQR